VSLTKPAGSPQAALAVRLQPLNTSSPHSGKRVLIVDDELSNRRLAARMLQRMQVTSVSLEDGDEVRFGMDFGDTLEWLLGFLV
jgi:hypothetical protein